MTVAPCSASASEHARPMPREPPVTRATLPSSRNMGRVFAWRDVPPESSRPEAPRRAQESGEAEGAPGYALHAGVEASGSPLVPLENSLLTGCLHAPSGMPRRLPHFVERRRGSGANAGLWCVARVGASAVPPPCGSGRRSRGERRSWGSSASRRSRARRASQPGYPTRTNSDGTSDQDAPLRTRTLAAASNYADCASDVILNFTLTVEDPNMATDQLVVLAGPSRTACPACRWLDVDVDPGSAGPS